MSYIVKAGTPAPRYPIVKGTADPRGLYPWSVLEGRISYLGPDGEVVAADYIANGDTGALLVFCCDVPVLFKGITGKGTGSTSPYFFDIGNSRAEIFLLREEPVALSPIVEIADFGQVGIGYTLTNLVPCSGFGSDEVTVLVNGGGTSVATSLDIQVFALGDVISAPIGPATHNGSTTGLTPIFLLESDYTQAIADADNIIVDGLNDKLYLVVGLHDFAPPAP